MGFQNSWLKGIKLIVQEQLNQFLYMRRLPSEHIGAQYFKSFLWSLSFVRDFAADVASPTLKKVSQNPWYFNKHVPHRLSCFHNSNSKPIMPIVEFSLCLVLIGDHTAL